MGTLYVVATPIGNLEDITLRALRVLKEVDVIFCEDTRVTKKLLAHYGIETPTKRYDAHASNARHEEVLSRLESGETLALVTDAGTPGISDPGFKLLDLIRTELPDARIEAVPGASALAGALSVAGLSSAEFLFLGFPPHKKGRETFFREIGATDRAVVFYESPHRLLKALEALRTILPAGRRIAVVREITKLHESAVRGTAEEVAEHFEAHPDQVRGECVIIVEAV